MGKQAQAKVRVESSLRRDDLVDDESIKRLGEIVMQIQKVLGDVIKRDDVLDVITNKQFVGLVFQMKTKIAKANQMCLKEMGTYRSRQCGIPASEYNRLMKNPETYGIETLLRMAERISGGQKKTKKK